MAEIAATATPLSLSSMGQILCGAYTELYGQPPSKNLGEISLALLAVENAGGRAIIQYNWGNLATYSGYTGDYWSRESEQYGLRSYQAKPSHKQGAIDWWKQMFRRYRNFIYYATIGDWDQAGASIVRDGYCPEPDCTVSMYQKALKTWKSAVPKAMQTCKFSPMPTSIAGYSTGDTVVGPIVLMASVIGLGAFELVRRGWL